MKTINNVTALWELCNRENLFTCGSNEQYERIYAKNDEGVPLRQLASMIWICSENVTLDEVYSLLKKLQKKTASKPKVIRFIDTNYNTLFTVFDGEKVRLTRDDGEIQDKKCRYIDDYHVALDDSVYHICHLAELAERNGFTLSPITE